MTLNELVADVLEVEPSTIDSATSRATLDRWDSLAHITLITTIEETYEVTFSLEEMVGVKSFGDLEAVLAAKGVGV